MGPNLSSGVGGGVVVNINCVMVYTIYTYESGCGTGIFLWGGAYHFLPYLRGGLKVAFGVPIPVPPSS